MRVGALYAVLRLETAQFDAALGASKTKMGAFMGVMRAAALVGIQAFAAVAGASLFMAQGFEQHMTESLAIMSDVSGGMREKMEAAARAVAKTSTFSANQAADAYYYLASAGFTAEQSISALPAVTQFAQAGLIDLEKATSLLLDTTTTMGLRSADATQNMENMTRVSDVLSAAAIESNASLEEMAVAMMNKAGPALRVLGKDVEEGAAVLMVMANAGVKGKVAGTNLGIVLRELQTKAIQNKDAFKEAGVAVYDASGEMRNMGDIVADLEGRLKGLTDEQKKQALLDLGFTDRSVGVIQSLLGTSGAIKKYEADLREAGGTTKDVAEKQLDSFNAQATIMWHKIQDVGITIGQKLLPGARDMVEAFGNWIDANGDLIASIVVGVMGALGALIGLLGRGVGLIGDAAKVVGEVLAPSFDLIGEALEPAIKFVSTIINRLDHLSDFAGADTPLGMLGDIFAAFGEAAEWVSEEALPGLSDGLATIVEELLPILITGFSWFAEEVVPLLVEAFRVIVEDVLPLFIEIFRVLVEEVVPRLIDVFTTVAATVLPAVAIAFDFLTTEVLPRIGDAFNWLRENVIPPLMSVFEFVVSWFIANWPTISDIATQVFGAVGEAFKIVANVIGFIVPIIWGLVQPIAAVLFPTVGAAASVLLSALDIAFRAIGGVFDVFGDVATAVFRAVTLIWEGLAGFFTGVWTEVSGVFKGGINVIIDLLNGFIGFLNNIHIDIPRIAIPGTDIGVGGGTIDPFNISTVPRLARGVRAFSGGLAMVGEHGPELAYLPRGTDIFTNGQSRGMMNGEMTVTIRDPDGGLARGGYDQKAIERAVTDAVRELVGGARHRSLRVGST